MAALVIKLGQLKQMLKENKENKSSETNASSNFNGNESELYKTSCFLLFNPLLHFYHLYFWPASLILYGSWMHQAYTNNSNCACWPPTLQQPAPLKSQVVFMCNKSKNSAPCCWFIYSMRISVCCQYNICKLLGGRCQWVSAGGWNSLTSISKEPKRDLNYAIAV